MGSFIVVDDDFSIRHLIKTVLKYAGHEIIADVDSIKSAMQYFNAGKVPDVILLDMVLPGALGCELIDYLREHHKSVKIIMCTGLNEEKVMKLIPPGRYDAYIQKPFKTDEFIKTVSSLLPA